MSSSARQAEYIPVPLRELDEVAYLRFASVYRRFESADDFETEIAMLRAESWRSYPSGHHQEEKGDQPECRDFSIDSSTQNDTDQGQTDL